MNYRQFGRTGWSVSEIGYGMWGMGGWSGSDDEESFRSLQRAADLGCNFFDTAWAYGDGRSEKLLGQLVRANPGKRFYTATKIPPKNLRWPSRREFALDDCFPPDHIEEYVHKSLKNADLEALTLSSFTLGKMRGQEIGAGSTKWRTCAARARSMPLESASTAGNPGMECAPCKAISSTPSR